jgi:hypothetical protein
MKYILSLFSPQYLTNEGSSKYQVPHRCPDIKLSLILTRRKSLLSPRNGGLVTGPKHVTARLPNSLSQRLLKRIIVSAG